MDLLDFKQGPAERIEEFVERVQDECWKKKVDFAYGFKVMVNGVREKEKIRDLGRAVCWEELKEMLERTRWVEQVMGSDKGNDTMATQRTPVTRRGPITCFKCGKEGHIATRCFGRVGMTADSGLQTKSIQVDCDTATLRVGILGRVYEALVDSGASRSLISQALVDRLKIRTRLCEEEKRCTLANNGFTMVREWCGLNLVIGEGEIYNEFFVLDCGPDSDNITLGRDFMRENKTEFVYMSKGPSHSCRIETSPDTTVCKKNHRVSYHVARKVEKEAEDLLSRGFIEPSESSWANPIRPVEKPNGKIRLCLDLRDLNRIVKSDNYSLPRITEILEGLKGKTFFSKIGLKDAFYSIEIIEEHRHKTAFMVGHKLYQWTRMPMGFKNTPSIFQRAIDKVLQGVVGIGCQVYVDDIVVFGETKEEHDRFLTEVLRRLRVNGFVINREKSKFGIEEIEYLGFVVSKDTRRPKMDPANPIEQYPRPTSPRELQRFLGLVNYYRTFINNCARVQEPLTRLCRKGVKFVWEEEQERAFAACKEALLGEKVLRLPDFRRRFVIYTDASDEALGAILSQEDDSGKEYVVQYASRTLTSAERKYSISEKECLGIVYAVEHFQYYVRGTRFKLITDHQALAFLQGKDFKNYRINRWYNRVMEYDFEIEYREGSKMGNVDPLSRILIGPNEEERGVQEKIREAHVLTGHHGRVATKEKLKEMADEAEPKIKDKDVERVLRGCDKCLRFNDKRQIRYVKVGARRPLEKVAADIMGPVQGKYVLNIIDYYSRFGRSYVIKGKDGTSVMKCIKKFFTEHGTPDTMITDNENIFLDKRLQMFFRSVGTDHHLTTPHKHTSNGRVERFNKAIGEIIKKLDGRLEVRVEKANEYYNNSYNNSWHSAIKNKPVNLLLGNEMNIGDSGMPEQEPSTEDFKVDGVVLMERHTVNRDKFGPRFEGKVMEILGNGTFKVMVDGVPRKRHYTQMKRLPMIGWM